MKRGADGCIAVGPEMGPVRVSAPPVDVIDSTGAGDAFNAALMVSMASGSSHEDALRFAVRVASSVVSRASSDRYPTRDEVIPGVDCRQVT